MTEIYAAGPFELQRSMCVGRSGITVLDAIAWLQSILLGRRTHSLFASMMNKFAKGEGQDR